MSEIHISLCFCQQNRYLNFSFYQFSLILNLVATLHLAFKMNDGKIHHLDVDLNIPSFKTSNSGLYDGDSAAFKEFLIKTKPRGWREQLPKVVQMSSAEVTGNGGVRVRMIAKDTFIASQCSSFNTGRALVGLNLKVYVLLKLLKFLVSAEVKSYEIKWAVQSLQNTFPGQIIHDWKMTGPDWKISCRNGERISGLGQAVRKVLDFHTIRGKFEGINPGLLNLGFCKIEVTDVGFHIRSCKSKKFWNEECEFDGCGFESEEFDFSSDDSDF